VIDATLTQHEHQFGELLARLESTEEVLRLVPEILERLGPEALTPEHQRTVQHAAKRLHDAGGYAYATVYAELGEHFHVAKHGQIPEARWQDVAEWFRVRIATAEKRRKPS
jgi:predicted fused transcriptional regulator/phosphomethylpyrimidine kinase